MKNAQRKDGRRKDAQRIVAVCIVLTLFGAMFLTLGCQEQRVAAPNEKTAAPARLPGEDPHARTPTQTEKTRK